MNSKRVACKLALLVNIENSLCFIALFDHARRAFAKLGRRPEFRKPYYYSAKSSTSTIHSVGASENRKIKLLARTRRQTVRRCEIYVLRVGPTLTMFVDDFVAKFLRQKLVQLGPIFVKLHLSIKNTRPIKISQPGSSVLKPIVEIE